MTNEEILYGRPQQTPTQRENGERAIALMQMSRQPSGLPTAEQEEAWEKQAKADRDAELRARGMEPPADPNAKAEVVSLSSEPQTQEERWEREAKEARDIELRHRGLI